MFKDNMPLVYSFVKRIAPTKANHLTWILDDLIEAGSIGLIRAIKRFDASKGFKLSTYAAFWIRKHILEQIAKEQVHSYNHCSIYDVNVNPHELLFELDGDDNYIEKFGCKNNARHSSVSFHENIMETSPWDTDGPADKSQWEKSLNVSLAVKSIKKDFIKRHKSIWNVSIKTIVKKITEQPNLYAQEIQELRGILNGRS